MALIDLIRTTCDVSDLVDFERVLVTQPQKVDSPKVILEKYAKGIPVFGDANPSYQSDDCDDDDKMLESVFIDDDMDARQYVMDFGNPPEKAPNLPQEKQSPPDKGEDTKEEEKAL